MSFERYRLSDEEFEEIYDRDHKHWTKKEERKVINKIQDMDKENDSSYIYGLISKLGREVGRTKGSLLARFGYYRLKVEWQWGLLKREKYLEFFRSMEGKWTKQNEWRRKLKNVDSILGQDIMIEKVKDRLKGNYEDKWELPDYYKRDHDILIDKEDDNESS